MATPNMTIIIRGIKEYKTNEIVSTVQTIHQLLSLPLAASPFHETGLFTKHITFHGAQPPNVLLWARVVKRFDLGPFSNIKMI